MFWAVLSKMYSCLWTPSLIIICQFFECVQSVFLKWYYIDISIKINNILKLWKEIVPYRNEFYLARLGMQFKTNINYSRRKKEIEIYLKNKRKRNRFYQYILVHDFCKSWPDISILNSTFIIIMQYHVELTNMYYCIWSLLCEGRIFQW